MSPTSCQPAPPRTGTRRSCHISRAGLQARSGNQCGRFRPIPKTTRSAGPVAGREGTRSASRPPAAYRICHLPVGAGPRIESSASMAEGCDVRWPGGCLALGAAFSRGRAGPGVPARRDRRSWLRGRGTAGRGRRARSPPARHRVPPVAAPMRGAKRGLPAASSLRFPGIRRLRTRPARRRIPERGRARHGRCTVGRRRSRGRAITPGRYWGSGAAEWGPPIGEYGPDAQVDPYWWVRRTRKPTGTIDGSPVRPHRAVRAGQISRARRAASPM